MAIQTRFYYHLPISVMMHPDILGADISISLLGFNGMLHLPGVDWNKENRPYLTKPEISDHAYAMLKQRSDDLRFLWGSINGWDPKNKAFDVVHLSSFLLDLNLDTNAITYSNYLHGRGHPLSDQLTSLNSNIDEWFTEFCAWVAIVTKQDLNVANPLSSVKTPGAGFSYWTEEDDVTSLIGSPFVIATNIDSEAPKKVLHKSDLIKIFAVINSGRALPQNHLLLNDAREAQARGLARKAANDAGSAVEITLRDYALSNSMALPARPTLGWYVQNISSLPADTNTKLLDVRNDAEHFNATFNPLLVPDAITIATQIVESFDPLIL